MSMQAKLGIGIVLLFSMVMILALTSNDGLGSFPDVRAAGEINQTIQVVVDKSKGFQKDAAGRILAFYARDKNGESALISLKEPGSPELAGAEIVEIFGHMHGETFIAVWAKVVES